MASFQPNPDALDLPRLYGIDEVISVFETAGFVAAAGQLPIRFVPASGDQDRMPMLDRLDYYRRTKLILRFEHADARRQ